MGIQCSSVQDCDVAPARCTASWLLGTADLLKSILSHHLGHIECDTHLIGLALYPASPPLPVPQALVEINRLVSGKLHSIINIYRLSVLDAEPALYALVNLIGDL